MNLTAEQVRSLAAAEGAKLREMIRPDPDAHRRMVESELARFDARGTLREMIDVGREAKQEVIRAACAEVVGRIVAPAKPSRPDLAPTQGESIRAD